MDRVAPPEGGDDLETRIRQDTKEITNLLHRLTSLKEEKKESPKSDCNYKVEIGNLITDVQTKKRDFIDNYGFTVLSPLNALPLSKPLAVRHEAAGRAGG
jgi:hypothetical protein